jgi:glycosyltransferase involved in cell wall biosynthesis
MRNLADLKVAFVAGTLGQGGAERQLYYIVATLCRAGARVDVLCLTRGEFWEAPLAALGASVTWVGEHAARARRLAEVVRCLRRLAPDVVQSHHFYTNLYASLAARVLALRDIGALRSDAISEVRDSGRVLGPLSLRVPRLVVANSRAGLINAMRLGVPASRLRMLTNVVDERVFTPSVPNGDDAVTIIAVGRLGPEKRLDRLLTVLARLRKECAVPCRGLIVGDGHERVALERQAATLGLLPHAVEFRGAVASAAPTYGEADVLVLTSDWEGTPNVVLEAMASGLPVVATEVGGVGDLVEDGRTGFLVPRGDGDRLFSALHQLVSNPPLRRQMGQNGRARVLERHSIVSLPQQLAALYERVV